MKCSRFLSTSTKGHLRTIEPWLCRDFNLKGKIKKFCAGGVRLDPENAIIKLLKLIFSYKPFGIAFILSCRKKWSRERGASATSIYL